MINFNGIRNQIISTLASGLSSSLTYHNLNHTLDVEKQCLAIAHAEGITDEQSLLELRIAALYHDAGFLFMYKGHEEKGCELAKTELAKFGLAKKTIDNICGLILATKIPQQPKNHLQQIICDADLDYLGRDDYFIINENLYKEFMEYGLIKNEYWEESKINFLKSHKYFTNYSQRIREPKKLFYLEHLLAMRDKKDNSLRL